MLFKDIIGHKDLKYRLIQSVREGRIPHAQLFCGPEGSGNLPLALAYARYLNCRDRQPDDSCGRCPSCLQFTKLVHPDLHFVYPVATTSTVKEKPKSVNFIEQWRQFLLSNNAYVSLNGWYEAIDIEKKQGIINTEDCNEMIRTLGYKSYESEYKIMVVWMAEKLFHAAAPRILKILEEPPDKTVFLLIAENTDLILSTILSRTQLIKIPRISDDDLMDHLHNRLQEDEHQLRQAVNMSNGNLIEALAFLAEKEGDDDYESFRNWMLMCFRRSIPEIQAFVDEYSKYTREKLKSFLHYGIIVYRYCYHIHLLEKPEIRMEGKELEFVQNFSKYVHPANTPALYQLLNEAIYHIERNANTSILLMDLSLQVSTLLKMPPPKKIS